MKSFDGSRSPTQSQITIAHTPVTSQELEIGLPKVKIIATGSLNPSRFSGLTAKLAAARLFLAPQSSRILAAIATKIKDV
jgi:hypothetical protein